MGSRVASVPPEVSEALSLSTSGDQSAGRTLLAEASGAVGPTQLSVGLPHLTQLLEPICQYEQGILLVVAGCFPGG